MRRLSPRAVSVFLSSAFFVLPFVASAATINVPADYPTIQAAINAAAPGDTIKVFPGSYTETAPNSTLTVANGGGTYIFGLFFPEAKPGLKLVGVDAGGNPITNAASVLADITTVGDANFGPDGIMVEASSTVIQGVKINGNLDPNTLTPSNNKTIEVIGDNFTLQYSQTNVPDGGGSIYIDDFSPGGTVVKAYHILDNIFPDGTSVDVASGAGNTGPVTSREILRNKWDLVNNGFNGISFNGSGGQPWFVNPVGGAVIKNNEFKNSTQYIRQRGVVTDQTQFDWQSYWNDNTFDKAAIALVTETPFDVRSYSYSVYTNVRRIGAIIQNEIKDGDGVDHAQAGDTILVKAGSYPENVTIDRTLKLKGAKAGVAVSGRTFANAAESTVSGQAQGTGAISISASASSVDGFSITDVHPLFASFGVVVKAAGTNAVIKNNIIDTITSGDTSSNGTAQGVYLQGGPGSVWILNNKFNNIHSNRSAKAVLLGDNGGAASTNILIQDNTMTNIVSDTRGAYGVSIPNATSGQTGLQIQGNTINTLTGGWVHAIGVEGNAPGININHNVISGLSSAGADVIAVWFENPDTSFSSSLVNRNSLDVGATRFGIAVHPALSGAPLDGTCNWWGNASGPGPIGPGTGSMVTASTTYTPWLTTSNLDGVCNGGLKGGITVTKNANGGAGTFNFTGDNGIGNFSITTTGSPNSTGSKSFYNLPVGTYHITETASSTWTMNSNTCSTIVVSNNATSTCTVTNTKNPTGKGAIFGFKFEDKDGDGKLSDDGNKRLNGWTIYIDSNNNGSLDSGEPTSVTSGSGVGKGLYSFTNLPAGTYVIREVVQAGWIPTYPSSGKYVITLANNQSYSYKNFGNFKLGSISGMKFNDLNGNKKKDSGEPGLPGWTIKLKKPDGSTVSTVTDAGGNYSFTGLKGGTYTLSEVMQSGWTQKVAPSPVTIYSGVDSTGNNFGNKHN